LALGSVLVAQLVVVLDFSIVNVALRTLSAELGVSADAAQWVVTAYALTFGGLLVLGGRAADLFGRRKVLTVGLVSFAVASAAGGLASDMPMLIASRAVQGIAAALIAPASLSILTTSFREGRARNRVLGLYGITASVGFVLGLVAGGVLVDTVGWRGVFFVNVPICLAMAAIGRRRLPAMRSTEVRHHLDLAGALTAAAAMLVLAPSIGASDGWTSGALAACLIGGAVCLVAFVRRERRSRDPVVPLGIFRQRARVGGDIVAGLVGAWVAAEVLVVSLYSQEVLAHSALAAGPFAIPQGVGGILRGIVGPTLLDRVGLRRFLVGNCILAAAGLAVLFRFPMTSRYPLLGLAFIVIGFGTTNVVFGATVAASSAVRDEEQGLASAVLNASRQIARPSESSSSCQWPRAQRPARAPPATPAFTGPDCCGPRPSRSPPRWSACLSNPSAKALSCSYQEARTPVDLTSSPPTHRTNTPNDCFEVGDGETEQASLYSSRCHRMSGGAASGRSCGVRRRQGRAARRARTSWFGGN
jgi:EmrB/QacA subfamily drug resistance transporter